MTKCFDAERPSVKDANDYFEPSEESTRKLLDFIDENRVAGGNSMVTFVLRTWKPPSETK